MPRPPRQSSSEGSQNLGRRISGEPFDPSHKVCGFYPPDVVGRQRDLTDGQKRLYERAVRWAGRNGCFWYAFETMADALGKSLRQVKADMLALHTYRLLSHVRRGGRRSNRYVFLWHPIFEVQSTALQDDGTEVQDSALEVQDPVQNSILEVQPTARESCNSFLNSVKESSSQSAAMPPTQLADASDDEDALPQKANPKTNTPEALPVPEASARVAAVPQKDETENGREALIETTREQLRLARASGLRMYGFTEADIRPPDRTITKAILGVFQDYADFVVWLETTLRRGLARKAKDTRWGLYLSDAKNHAEDIALARERDEKRRIDDQIARERQQAAEAEAVAEMDQPMSLIQAYGRIQVRMEGRKIPRWLAARLKRTGELISANELMRQICAWKRCPNCNDCGMVGNAIDRDLRFCSCQAGVEEAYGKGADWPANEIGRVHADAKSLLVAASHAIAAAFTADAIEAAEITDADGRLEIRLPVGHLGIDEGDVRKALKRLKWERQISITGGRQPQPASKPEGAAPTRPPITQADIDRIIGLQQRWQTI